MNIKICCVTGHRDIPKEKTDYVTLKLKSAIIHAVENGFTHFISGFAEGVDLIFADIVVELKAQYPILLEAAIPYQRRMKTTNREFRRLIKCCDVVKIHSEEYSKYCYMKRNRYMVEQSDFIIAVWDGRQTGGTIATLKYAERLGKSKKLELISIF